jgi:hypothetical protein
MKINLEKVSAYFINIDWQEGRRKQMESLLPDYFDSVRRISAYDKRLVSLPTNDETKTGYYDIYRHIVAIAHSHVKALKSVVKTPAIIFEDDVVPVKYRKKIVVPDDADIVYLGFAPYQIYEDDDVGYDKNWPNWKTDWAGVDKSDSSRHCYRLHGMLCNHAILYLTDRAVKMAIEAYQDARKMAVPVDVISKRLMKNLNVYVTKETMFAQEGQPDTARHAKDFKPNGNVILATADLDGTKTR